jgi:MFS family permease
MEAIVHRRFTSLILLLFVEGGVVLAHQIVAPKILAPLFGNSILVWTAVLVCTLAGLACGYVLGDLLARKGRVPRRLASTMIVSGLILLATPFVPSLGATILDSLPLTLGVLVGAGCVVTPVMSLLGTCSPLAVEIFSRGGYPPARATGVAFGVSTLGGVTAALAVGLWSIPLLGLRMTCLTGAVLLILTALLFLTSTSRPLSDHR